VAQLRRTRRDGGPEIFVPDQPGTLCNHSFDGELRDHVPCERQFDRSFPARYCMLMVKRATSAAFAGLNDGVGTSLGRGRIPMLMMGRRRLMPKREYVFGQRRRN
jgi:hypothetical protein